MAQQNLTTSEWPPRLAVCVGTVVLNGERVLLVRLAPGQSLAGEWSIPWGLVEPDETPEAAAVRETREEGGVEVDIEGLLGVQNLRQPGWLGIVFLGRHVDGVPSSDGGHETDDAGYFSLAEIEAFDQLIEPWCEWLVRRVLQGEHHLIPAETDNPYRPSLAFL